MSTKVWNFKSQKYNDGVRIDSETIMPLHTKERVRSLYPDGNYQVEAEYAPGNKKDQVGILSYEDTQLPLVLYRSSSRIKYKEKGFVAVDSEENRFVAILTNVLPLRILALLICLVILGGGIAAAVSLTNGAEIAAAASPTPVLPELETGAVDWEGIKQPQNTGGVAKGIAIPGFKSITIDADTTDVRVNFFNPEGNPCYFVISLLLGDGTTLYKSKHIEPGKGLYNIKLEQPVSNGEYDAVLKYETFSLTDLSPMNGAEVRVKLIAK